MIQDAALTDTLERACVVNAATGAARTEALALDKALEAGGAAHAAAAAVAARLTLAVRALSPHRPLLALPRDVALHVFVEAVRCVTVSYHLCHNILEIASQPNDFVGN